MDITSNQTLVARSQESGVEPRDGTDDSVGISLASALGTYKNVQDAGSIFRRPPDSGFEYYSFRLDLAGGYDFNEGGAVASGGSAGYFNGILKPCSCLHHLRRGIFLCLLPLLVAGCGGLQEVWEGPGARMFRPQAIAVLPPMASQYDSAREDIQEGLVRRPEQDRQYRAVWCLPRM